LEARGAPAVLLPREVWASPEASVESLKMVLRLPVLPEPVARGCPASRRPQLRQRRKVQRDSPQAFQPGAGEAAAFLQDRWS